MTLIAVVGPTAAGKSQLAVALAEETGGEVVSVDSMQVYRGMDIGTAKPTEELRERVPHHLVDIAEPEDSFSVAEFQAVGRGVLGDLDAKGTTAVIAGGSGLHFRALVDPLDFPPTDDDLRAELAELSAETLVERLLTLDDIAGEHVDLANRRRVQRAVEVHMLTGRTPSDRAVAQGSVAVKQYEPMMPMVVVGLDPGDALAARAESRMDRMLERGLLDEVHSLAPRLGLTARQAVGYKELLPVTEGEATLQEGRAMAVQATLALAKRQRTFFRRDPRVQWQPWSDDPGERLSAARRVFEEAPA